MENRIETEIYKIQSDLGLTASGIARAMNIAVNTFYNKKNPNNTEHSFNQKNLDDLKNFLKKYVKNLK
ncbi:hypothetical protein QP519_03055 [Weeksella virosa]|uniref:hypothetical protein n=1 Tax=Weeksella virosa TaxID=1014 RepID=UPI00255401E9|nr:hypothetical protein [Weeksella virosa]MDK7374515.1 hypothetical protein [Weeksella virosa]